MHLETYIVVVERANSNSKKKIVIVSENYANNNKNFMTSCTFSFNSVLGDLH